MEDHFGSFTVSMPCFRLCLTHLHIPSEEVTTMTTEVDIMEEGGPITEAEPADMARIVTIIKRPGQAQRGILIKAMTVLKDE